MASPRILLFQMGLNDFVGERFQSFYLKRNVLVDIVRPAKQETCLDSLHLDQYDGIIVSGSTFMVTDQHNWSVKSGELLKPIIQEGKIYMLGICYGHQLMIDSIGGQVNYVGKRQLGSKTCELLDEDLHLDPLFSIFQKRDTLTVHVLHRQMVTKIPDSVKVICKNDVDDFHACRLGERCWTTQFHPEMSYRMLEQIVEFQKDTLAVDGLDYEITKASIQNTTDGDMLLDRFAELCWERFREKHELCKL